MESNADITLDQLLQRASASLLTSLEAAVDVEQALAELHRQATERQADANEPGRASAR
ncbi:hypothetical protein [Bailinhaonella thermotolerans]|uniref:hypothetical protein n=1 Tax=Bailinhaonella thermotolerans TaxID=1070861 RepID=UPI00192A50F9|nr:hypothetical protein [Bailinhaonella thermotolerans]